MKQIELTQGQFALVDDADYIWLKQWKWCAYKPPTGGFYAVRNSSLGNGKKYLILMHRQILRLGYGDKRQGDHIDHNTLDNRRDNLRICTPQQNQKNRKSQQNTSSRFKGVCWDKKNKKWEVKITINDETKHLGRFDMEEVAALRYDMVAIREHGEFACLNF